MVWYDMTWHVRCDVLVASPLTLSLSQVVDCDIGSAECRVDPVTVFSNLLLR